MSVPVTVDVLDGVHGCTAAGMPVRLERVDASLLSVVAHGLTGENGCWRGTDPEAVSQCRYRVVCDAGRYYAGIGLRASIPEAAVGLRALTAPVRISILLAPAGYAVHVDSGSRTW